MQKNCAVILAAGEGTRMKSVKPKVLCEVLFRPMLGWVLDACREAEAGDICVVTGYGREQVRDYLCETMPQAETVYQPERRGTGHAVLMARDVLEAHRDGQILVLCGDAPFMDAETIKDAYAYHTAAGNAATVITARLSDPTGYGRIIRDGDMVAKIVEEKDATDAEARVDEVNSGAYWFAAADLLDVLGSLDNDNAKGEYYLTDTIELLLEEGKKAGAFIASSPDVILGANDRKGLCTLTKVARDRIIDRHFANGVEFVSTDGVLISAEAEIGAGTCILPGTIIKGKTTVGADCVLGPNTLLENMTVEDRVTLNAVQAYESIIHSDVKIGPFTHIRPNSEIHSKVKIGDFVEIKNSTIGAGTAVAHLTYVGDSDVGKNVNFGCGCVTVNYDGINKFRTTIGDDAFIGCNTNLVAPVKVGDGAYTAAGSTITKDVPDGALGIARNRQENKEGFAEKKLKDRPKKA